MSNEIVVECRGLSKSYHDADTAVGVISGVDLSLEAGSRTAIVGPSGAGKSTLLHLLGGLDKPTAGQVLIKNQDWQSLSEKQRCVLRNRELGFVYQFHHLLPEFSALENVAMPLLIANIPVDVAVSRAKEILQQVGLQAREQHKPSQLSGGERQRVAIARALVNQPSCVFADEPTGNLDQTTASKVFEIMLELNASKKTALVIVTHDKALAARMDRVMTLRDGRLQQL